MLPVKLILDLPSPSTVTPLADLAVKAPAGVLSVTVASLTPPTKGVPKKNRREAVPRTTEKFEGTETVGEVGKGPTTPRISGGRKPEKSKRLACRPVSSKVLTPSWPVNT